MIGVKMQSVVQCGGGWTGSGMTIGFREPAMWTDGPWLPPKIPLRKMAELTYFWTHHAVQIHCAERYSKYLHSDIVILALFVGHYRITYIVTVASVQESIRWNVAVMQHKNSGNSYSSSYPTSHFPGHCALERLMRSSYKATEVIRLSRDRWAIQCQTRGALPFTCCLSPTQLSRGAQRHTSSSSCSWHFLLCISPHRKTYSVNKLTSKQFFS